ncbi:MAG: M20 family peptidase [Saprospiraceae bacterium]|nr:M20 family peptidase [Saprospiraceae bacterium]
MKKLTRFLLVAGLLTLVVVIGLLGINYTTYSSKQIPVQAVLEFSVPDSVTNVLSKAIQIPTVGTDSSAFRQMQHLLTTDFPLVDSFLQKQTINDLSLIYQWPGKRPDLPPILLLAHQDVVPAEPASLDQWSYPPFSGTIAENYIWGRGTLDDKSPLIAILTSVEMLLREGYSPERTIYLAFGHDEEVGGSGARAIANYFQQQSIQFEYILDEGHLILNDGLDGLDAPMAVIGVTEKGYVTLNLTARLKDGGHSMMPPKETAVGILSKAINKLQENPFPARMNPPLQGLLRYTGPEMNFFNQIIFSNLWLTEGLILRQLSQSPATNAVIRTTTAPTMIRAGIRDNVLPTQATAKVNFRILPGDDIESVQAYVRKVINDERIIVQVSDLAQAQNPAPVSGTDSFGFEVLQTTIQQVFPDVVVAPGLVISYTDSRHFVALSKHIYRFAPLQIYKEELKGFHGIDERLRVTNYLQMIHFYHRLIQNSCK